MTHAIGSTSCATFMLNIVQVYWVEREGVNEAAGKGRKGGGGVELQSKFHQVTISNHIAIISLMILSSSDSTNGKVSVLRLSIPLKNLSF